MEVDAEPEFAKSRTGIGPDDYVEDVHLPFIMLLEENTCRAAEKGDEWYQEAELHEKIFVELNSDEDE
jgi:hypothetical protein